MATITEIENFCNVILDSGALEIRDVQGGEEPFLYSSGNWGPGYVMIKGLVSRPAVMKALCGNLAEKVVKLTGGPDLVAGNVTGGMIPGWQIASHLHVPFVYVRDTRKKGGHKELVTGLRPGLHGQCLVVEELVNFAQTTVNSAEILRDLNFKVQYAATILSYDNPKGLESIKNSGLNLISLITLPDLLDVAERSGKFAKSVVDDYRLFLWNPNQWQSLRGFEPVTSGGTK